MPAPDERQDCGEQEAETRELRQEHMEGTASLEQRTTNMEDRPSDTDRGQRPHWKDQFPF